MVIWEPPYRPFLPIIALWLLLAVVLAVYVKPEWVHAAMRTSGM